MSTITPMCPEGGLDLPIAQDLQARTWECRYCHAQFTFKEGKPHPATQHWNHIRFECPNGDQAQYWRKWGWRSHG